MCESAPSVSANLWSISLNLATLQVKHVIISRPSSAEVSFLRRMCGRARCTLRPDAVSRACGVRAPARIVDGDRCRQSYNVTPGAYMPVLRYDNQDGNRDPVVQGMRWGLVPSFTKKDQKPDYFRMFNARSESVGQKASFRRLLPRNRCLAAVEGFYEWKKDGSKKQPYYIHFKDGRPLVFAALYDRWKDGEGNELYTFTILTTRCSKSFEWLHDRMPVILGSQDAVNAWFGDELTEDDLKRLTEPYEAPDLVWIPVTPAMGKPSFNGPECVEPVKLKARTDQDISQIFGQKQAHDALAEQCIGEKGKAVCDDFHQTYEEEGKAMLAGMEPDQDITEALYRTNETGDGEAASARVLDHVSPRTEKSDWGPDVETKATMEADKGDIVKDPNKEAGDKKRKMILESPKSKRVKSPVGNEKQKTLFAFFGRT